MRNEMPAINPRQILATVMRLDASMSTEHKQKRRQSDRHLEDLITEADEATRDT